MQELTWKHEWCPRILLWCSMQAHQHPWQVGVPRWTCSACTQGILELPVHTLNHPVALRMVGSSEHVLDAQALAGGHPQ